MVRGQPDFGMYAPKTISASISDMGEVAARLGSIVVYDKRGDVVDFDNFEEPNLRWQKGAVPTGGDSYFSNLTAKGGSQSYYMYPAASAGATRHIKKYYQVIGTKRLGVEISFCKLIAGSSLVLNLWYYSGSKRYKAAAKVDASTDKVYILASDLSWLEVADVNRILDEYFAFQTIKMVVDFDTLKYVRLLYINQEFDISTTNLNSFAAGVVPSFFVQIENEALSAAGGGTWIDDFIFTQAEP